MPADFNESSNICGGYQCNLNVGRFQQEIGCIKFVTKAEGGFNDYSYYFIPKRYENLPFKMDYETANEIRCECFDPDFCYSNYTTNG